MEFSAQQIAELLNGELKGDPAATVNTLAAIEEGRHGALSFVADAKFLPHIAQTEASILIIDQSIPLNGSLPEGCTAIIVENARVCFAKLLEMYDRMRFDISGVSDKVNLAATAKLGNDVFIGAYCHIGENVVLGDGVKVFPNTYIGDGTKVGAGTRILSGVNIYPQSEIGKDCIIHSGTVIGGDGFGFAPSSDQMNKVPHIGNVVLGDRVEIGSNCSIDRGTLGSTRIHDGVKLDNLIQVAHNVEIGENTVIAAQTGIAGSSTIGKNCMIGGQVGIAGHLRIADGVKIQAQSGIASNIEEEDAVVQGSPAFNIKEFLRSYVHFKNISNLEQRVRELEKALKE